MYHKRTECGVCGNKDLKPILEYGKVSLAGSFPKAEEVKDEKLYNLSILFCPKCTLVQTDSIIDPETLFRDYRYMSSIGLSKHFEGVAKLLKDKFSLNNKSQVIEIGNNDGVLLVPLKKLGINATGFEPATNIAQVAEDRGVNVINEFFNSTTVKEYVHEESIDLVISNNCFAHIEDLHSLVEGIKYCLKPNGHFVFEVSYIKDLIEQMQYDTFYHEHIYYYSLYALSYLFRQHAMTIVDCEFIPIHNGSIRVTVKNGTHLTPKGVEFVIGTEMAGGMTSIEWYNTFSLKVNAHISMIKNKIKDLKSQGRSIIGYGASGRANMICNICDLDSIKINYIVDESPERTGRYIAGKGIPIVKNIIGNPDYIVIFAWNFAKMIIDKLQGRGYKFIVFFPLYKVVENSSELELGI